jgi:tritrans,polycis-undecaprenyl-diphosphate synthase [geranylgeranyl-diphosphate specific]
MSLVRQDPIPEHIAIIMDGNRRYAIEMGLDPLEGHQQGRDKLKEVLEWCLDLDLKVLTVYAFSTENFNRAKIEVKELMTLFERNFRILAEDKRVKKYKIRIQVFGQLEILPDDVKASINEVMERTKDHDRYFYNMAVAYGGRQEIVNAIQNIGRDVKDGKIQIDDIDETLVSSYLYTQDMPDPDLIIRTSGEERISNFLLWQMAYSELYFTDVFWPGLTKVEFLRAIRSYQLRKRRHGT